MASLIATGLIAQPRPSTELAHFEPSYLPGMQGFITMLLGCQTLLLLAFTACIWAQRPWVVGSGRAGYRVAAAGFAAPLTAVLSWLVAGALCVGLGLWLARFLGTPVKDRDEAKRVIDAITGTKAGFPEQVIVATGPRPLIVPPVYFWAGAAAVLVLGTTLVVALIVFWRLRLRPESSVQRLINNAPVQATDPVRRQEIARWVVGRQRLARLTDYVDRILTAIAATGVLVMMIATVPYWRNKLSQYPDSLIPALAVPGVALIATSAAAVVSLTFWAFRDPSVRRYIGIIWDLATFWPRANHPLTPPCYAEQAVPDLLSRTRALTANASDMVVLSGHSQGSVLAAAVLLQMDPTTASRTGLITYGSPLRRLYGRFFPAYFGSAALDRVQSVAGPCWRNLWVPSDPIGGWQFDPDPDRPSAVDVPLADPVALADRPGGGYPVLVLHSGYFARTELADRTNEIARCRTAAATSAATAPLPLPNT